MNKSGDMCGAERPSRSSRSIQTLCKLNGVRVIILDNYIYKAQLYAAHIHLSLYGTSLNAFKRWRFQAVLITHHFDNIHFVQTFRFFVAFLVIHLCWNRENSIRAIFFICFRIGGHLKELKGWNWNNFAIKW